MSLTRPAKQNISRLAVDIDKPWTFIVLMLVLSPKINSYFEFDLGLGLDFGLGLKLVNNIKQGSSEMNEAFLKWSGSQICLLDDLLISNKSVFDS